MGSDGRQHAESVVGFTGTRRGMTTAQVITVEALLDDLSIVRGHHGDCIGADADFAKIAQAQGLPLVVHPPSDDRLRAYCGWAQEVRDPQPYLIRNQRIVDSTDWLIATPYETEEMVKGGTWFTIRYARQQGKRVVIVWRDGTTHIDGGDAR